MNRNQVTRSIACLLLAALLVAGCGTPTPGEETFTSPLGQTVATSVLPSPTPVPTAVPTAVPSPTPMPTATPTAAPSPMQLVVVHSNDNWGETEPCG